MLAQDYASAVAKSLEEGKELSPVLAGLKKVLEKKGHEKLYARILHELAHTFERGQQGTVVMVKDEADVKKFKAEIEQAAKNLKSEGEAEMVIDKTLIGGFVLRTPDAQIDRSYKSALINLYRSIITNR